MVHLPKALKVTMPFVVSRKCVLDDQVSMGQYNLLMPKSSRVIGQNLLQGTFGL